MSKSKISERFKTDVKAAASGRWQQLIPSLASVSCSALDGQHHPCPKCGGVDRFRVFNDFVESGGAICNQCFNSKNGDGLSTLAWLNGWDFQTTLKAVADAVGISPPAARGKGKARPDDHLQWMEWAPSIVDWWAHGQPGVATTAVQTLGGRLARYRSQFTVVAMPIYGPKLTGAAPVGWSMWNTQRQNPLDPHSGLLPVFTKPVKWQKVKVTGGSERGLLGEVDRVAAAETVWKVEGPSDMLALWSIIPEHLRGQHAVITNSAGASENPPQWVIELVAGKTVNVVHDCDKPGQAGAEKWAGQLARKAKAANNVQLPYAIAETKGLDLRDWIVAGGTFEQLTALAESAPEASPAEFEAKEAADDPHRLARLIMNDHTHAGVLGLRFWRDAFYEWKGGAYSILSSNEMKAKITSRIRDEFAELNTELQEKFGDDAPPVMKVTGPLSTNVRHALLAMTLLPDSVEPPAWIREDSTCEPAGNTIATADSILYSDRIGSGEECTAPPTPALFSLNSLTYRYDSSAECPQWQAFLESLWQNSPDQISTLQEIMGYLATPTTAMQKVFCFIGPKRSGKSTIARVISALVGERNVCAPTLSSLQGDFGSQQLLGKSVATINDARLSGRADENAIIEKILAISGEDAQSVNRKHLSHVTTRLRVRFLLVSNEIPRLRDASGALVSRMILLRFVRSFFGNEDHGLAERLLAELPGILNWALEGWRRLRDRGYFIQPEESTELIEEWEELSSPVTAFVRDCCIVKPNVEIEKQRLFEEWKKWAGLKNHHVGADATFAKNLMSTDPSIGTSRPRINGSRCHVYTGIDLQPGIWADRLDHVGQPE